MLTLAYRQYNLMTDKQKKILDYSVSISITILLLWAVWSFFRGQIVYDLIVSDANNFKNYLSGLGAWAEPIYVISVILELLIAFIPGWFVYPVGGAVFGLSKSVVLVLLGNFLGASISFWIGRKWGLPLLHKFISPEYVEKWESHMANKGAISIFLLKLNPLTSLDIWNYLAGASPISFWKFTVANLLGLIPLIIFSAYVGEESALLAPQILGILFVGVLVYIAWFAATLPQKIRKKNKK